MTLVDREVAQGETLEPRKLLKRFMTTLEKGVMGSLQAFLLSFWVKVLVGGITYLKSLWTGFISPVSHLWMGLFVDALLDFVVYN